MSATRLRMRPRHLIGAGALALAQMASAGTEPYFHPLIQSTAVATPNHINELNSPWQVPAGITQKNLMSMAEVEADVEQSLQRVMAGRNSSMFDMVAYDDSGRYIFIPHETPFGAGVSRYDTIEDTTHLLMAGDQESAVNDLCDADPEEPRDPTEACPAWDNDYAAFDPARYTPNGTVWLGEEWSGLGRIVEVMNPLAHPDDIEFRVLESIANVSHEGISFSQTRRGYNRVVYYVDEWNSGSIYKFVARRRGDYTEGQTFVLVVDEYFGDPTANWNEDANAGQPRTGAATWVPITNRRGEPLTQISPFRDGPTNDPRSNDDTRGGRPAADEVGGTPYGRPEDTEISVLANGNEVVYFTATSEHSVYAVEMLPGRRGRQAIVHKFAGPETPTNVGFEPTTGTLSSPDNLAIDHYGNIFIIEDKPNNDAVGGDIWFGRDLDNDGVAESIDHFLSIQVDGAEATGMIFHPTDPNRFVVAVQHPDSTDIDRDADEDGVADFECAQATPHACQGDALWEFDITKAVEPRRRDRR